MFFSGLFRLHTQTLSALLCTDYLKLVSGLLRFTSVGVYSGFFIVMGTSLSKTADLYSIRELKEEKIKGQWPVFIHLFIWHSWCWKVNSVFWITWTCFAFGSRDVGFFLLAFASLFVFLAGLYSDLRAALNQTGRMKYTRTLWWKPDGAGNNVGRADGK